jgi:hypothetical protein
LLLISGIPLLAATVAVTVIVTGTVAFAVASAAMMLVLGTSIIAAASAPNDCFIICDFMSSPCLIKWLFSS